MKKNRKTISVQIEQEQADIIEKLVIEKDLTKSQIVRRCLNNSLSKAEVIPELAVCVVELTNHLSKITDTLSPDQSVLIFNELDKMNKLIK